MKNREDKKMLMMSVKNFRDFLSKRIKETEASTKLSEENKNTRLQVLDNIMDLEILDPIYDKFDTVWLLSQAQYEYSVITNKLTENYERFNKNYKELEAAKKRVAELERSLKSYETMEASSGDFQEDEVRETIAETKEDIETETERLQGFFKVLEEEQGLKRMQNALHKLEGILTNPEKYFWYIV